MRDLIELAKRRGTLADHDRVAVDHVPGWLFVARKRGKHTRCCYTLGTAFGVAAKEEEGGYGWTT